MSTPEPQRSALANISDRVVRLYGEFHGKGPTRAKTYVQETSSRGVVGFMSGSQRDPDLIVEIFVLAPTEGDLFADAQAGDGE